MPILPRSSDRHAQENTTGMIILGVVAVLMATLVCGLVVKLTGIREHVATLRRLHETASRERRQLGIVADELRAGISRRDQYIAKLDQSHVGHEYACFEEAARRQQWAHKKVDERLVARLPSIETDLASCIPFRGEDESVYDAQLGPTFDRNFSFDFRPGGASKSSGGEPALSPRTPAPVPPLPSVSPVVRAPDGRKLV